MSSVRVVIPSRRRIDVVRERSLRWFPDATVCVAQSEAGAYREKMSNVVAHPDAVVGMGPLRQWILDNFSDERLLMADDDIYACYSVTRERKLSIDRPDDVRAVVECAAECAAGVGARIFGFSQAWDVRKFLPQKPVNLCGWVGGVVGFIGREVRYDQGLLLRADVDACLNSLLRHRIIYQDLRFSFAHKRFSGTGGNAAVRSEGQHQRELSYLLKKWGRHLEVRRTKTAVRLILNVDRTL